MYGITTERENFLARFLFVSVLRQSFIMICQLAWNPEVSFGGPQLPNKQTYVFLGTF